MSPAAPTVYGFDFGRLDLARRELTVSGRIVDLQPRFAVDDDLNFGGLVGGAEQRDLV